MLQLVEVVVVVKKDQDEYFGFKNEILLFVMNFIWYFLCFKNTI